MFLPLCAPLFLALRRIITEVQGQAHPRVTDRVEAAVQKVHVTVIGTVLLDVAFAPDYAELVATILEWYYPILEPIQGFGFLALVGAKLGGSVI